MGGGGEERETATEFTMCSRLSRAAFGSVNQSVTESRDCGPCTEFKREDRQTGRARALDCGKAGDGADDDELMLNVLRCLLTY